MASREGRYAGSDWAAAHIDLRADLNSAQLNALKRSIADAGKEARKSVRTRLKNVGVIVQSEIRSRTPVFRGKRYANRTRLIRNRKGNAARKTGAHTPGLLKRSTKLKIGRLSVAIYNDAKSISAKYPGGYRYGKRLEFDTNLGGRYAFFYPGWESKQNEAKIEFNRVLDDIAKTYGRKP